MSYEKETRCEKGRKRRPWKRVGTSGQVPEQLEFDFVFGEKRNDDAGKHSRNQDQLR